VLCVPSLKKNLLLVSTMEYKGFVINFQRGKVLICLDKSSMENTIFVGVREGNLYKLQGKLVHSLV
jgi:hypothetical protein